jgi:hypothetical protein
VRQQSGLFSLHDLRLTKIVSDHFPVLHGILRNWTRCAQYREKVVKFSLVSRRTFSYKVDFSSPNAVRNSAYGPQVRMSKLRSTPLRDTRPNWRNSSVPKLQCGGHRSEDLCVTPPTTSATTDNIPEKKRYETTVILIDHRAGAPAKTKKLKKWTDDFTDARNWLIHQLAAFRGDQYFAGVFDHKEKRSVFKEKGRIES